MSLISSFVVGFDACMQHIRRRKPSSTNTSFRSSPSHTTPCVCVCVTFAPGCIFRKVRHWDLAVHSNVTCGIGRAWLCIDTLTFAVGERATSAAVDLRNFLRVRGEYESETSTDCEEKPARVNCHHHSRLRFPPSRSRHRSDTSRAILLAADPEKKSRGVHHHLLPYNLLYMPWRSLQQQM